MGAPAFAEAVLWDFGGVILESPFDAFARYEAGLGLPSGFLRRLNATNPDTNAWAMLERSEVDLATFCDLFEAEALGAGHQIVARDVLACLSGGIRPEMVEAVRRCAERLPTGLVTNNFLSATPSPDGPRSEVSDVLGLFHVIIESSKVGLRKPDPRIYAVACEALGVRPEVTVFLDDLGINLKPARAMGMTTIKVVDPAAALDHLSEVVGFSVRD